MSAVMTPPLAAETAWLPGLESVEPHGEPDQALAERLLGPHSADVVAFLRLARAAGGPVLDLGSGDGRLALPLARLGFDVTAVDRCEASVERLRLRFDRARRRRAAFGDVTAVAAEMTTTPGVRRPGLIMLAGGVIAALDDAGRARLLAEAAQWLRPGGLIAFDHTRHDPCAVEADPVRWWSFTVPRYDGVVQSVLARQEIDPGARTETIHYDSHESDGHGLTRRAGWRTTKHLIDPATLAADLRRAGLRAVRRRAVTVGTGCRSVLVVCERRAD
ncbi:SAM-dependent methyltransferase [Allocatelliglobosispora scoriae]|uniref:SAM-dependent methyltransferase n=1 Tax=Allocatelliglobosispora scoriae TaxID=643052 RepID=A0A841C2R7_9ACTN|nr:methyltransferase domain-containing protein [Allocatelliglobosispora scoriae]MBB5874058.1 SAM-dependent methyltransferase [Allocatelliglobosispora scoriae]